MARAIRATPGFSRQCARWLLRKLKLGNLVMERDSSALTGQALAACKLDPKPRPMVVVPRVARSYPPIVMLKYTSSCPGEGVRKITGGTHPSDCEVDGPVCCDPPGEDTMPGRSTFDVP